jgi:serine/threonine protein kinase
MQKPLTPTDAVEMVRKSRLISEDRLSAYLEGPRADWSESPPESLLSDMVRHGLLTQFQAAQLGHGRWMGFEVGNYRILDRLGVGGMGQVFLAEHVNLGKRVALKVLDRRSASPLAMERFVREARAAAKLNHPNIIRVQDINPNYDPPYIVMDYVDGVTLQAAVARHGTFAPGEAASIGRQMALGLDEAYRHGLVHRDVKPANVLVDRHGVAKLLDLGIVYVAGESITQEYKKKTILGTIEYLAPEQAIDSSNVDTRADVYSLGATMYFLLIGTPPLPYGSMRERLAQLQAMNPTPLQILRPEIPEGLSAAIHCMLSKSPADRFATPLLAAEALEEFVEVTPPFPAKLFKHVRATLSDTEGSPTPSGLTEISAEPTTCEQSIEFVPPPTEADANELSKKTERELSRALLRLQKPRPRFAAWIAIVLTVIFGMLGIAFYISK